MAADGDRTSETYSRGNLSLVGALLPTPRTTDAQGAGVHGDGGLDLRTVVTTELLPTPKTRDGNHGISPAEVNRHAPSLGAIAGGLLPTPRASDGAKGGPNQRGSSGDLMLPSAVQPERWGRYAVAIARWEAVLGRPAPSATEPVALTKANTRACAHEWGIDGWAATEAVRAGLWRGRLSPRFVEWMMGADEGTVIAVPGVSRSAQLARLGNGVVRQQAAAAVRILLPELAAVPEGGPS